MANKINGLDNRPGPVGAGRGVSRARDATTGSNSSGAGSGASVDVEITGTAHRLAELEKSLASSSPIDEARVAATRNEIERGTYQVKPDHIADQMIQLEQSLGRLER